MLGVKTSIATFSIAHLSQTGQEISLNFIYNFNVIFLSQWPRDLRRRSAAARLLRLRVRIPPRHGCLSVVSVVCYQVEVSATG